MGLRTEITELIEACSQGPRENETAVQWGTRAAEETIDVLAIVVSKLDAKDKEADLAELKAEAMAAAQDVMNAVELPWGFGDAVPFIVGALIGKLGAYNDSVELFKTEHLLPLFTAIEAFGHRGRINLGA